MYMVFKLLVSASFKLFSVRCIGLKVGALVQISVYFNTRRYTLHVHGF